MEANDRLDFAQPNNELSKIADLREVFYFQEMIFLQDHRVIPQFILTLKRMVMLLVEVRGFI